METLGQTRSSFIICIYRAQISPNHDFLFPVPQTNQIDQSRNCTHDKVSTTGKHLHRKWTRLAAIFLEISQPAPLETDLFLNVLKSCLKRGVLLSAKNVVGKKQYPKDPMYANITNIRQCQRFLPTFAFIGQCRLVFLTFGKLVFRQFPLFPTTYNGPSQSKTKIAMQEGQVPMWHQSRPNQQQTCYSILHTNKASGSLGQKKLSDSGSIVLLTHNFPHFDRCSKLHNSKNNKGMN